MNNSSFLIFSYFCAICVLLFCLIYTGVLYAAPEIKINGLNSAQEDNVRAYLSLSQETCESPNWKIKRLFKQAPGQIQQALRALGYYHPQVAKSMGWKDDCWEILFVIDLGPPVIISTLDFQVLGFGAEDGFFIGFLQKINIKIGDTVNHGLYEKLKKDLQTLADGKGYFDNHFVVKQLGIDPDENQADIKLYLQTGRRYYISRIDIEKNALHTDFNSQFLAIESGQAYDRELIVKSHQLLDSAGYFKEIQLKYLQKQAEDYYAPLEVRLSNLPRHVLSAGVGYDTDLGFRLSAGYKNRFLNENGHQFISDLNLSLKKSHLVMEYVLPLESPLKDRLSFFTGLTYEDTSHVDSRKLDVGVRLSNRFYGQLVLAEQLNFVAEKFRNSKNDPYQTSYLLVPGISLSNVRAKKDRQYLDGYKYMMKLDAAHRSVGSTVSFIHALLHVKFAYSTFWGGRLISRVDLGATAVDDFDDLPSSFRFFAGGDNSVRGYDYKSIGQRDAAGEVIGGRYLTTASLEYEQRIIENWSMVTFIDAGDAFSQDLNIKFGVGLGVRWYSMVGPVRIDIAVPSDDFSDVHFHFSLSTAL